MVSAGRASSFVHGVVMTHLDSTVAWDGEVRVPYGE